MKLCRFVLFMLVSLVCAHAGASAGSFAGTTTVLSPIGPISHLPDSIIGVYLQFDRAAPQATLESMEAEISAIMKPAGLRFAWRRIESAPSSETFSDLIVLHFRGSCDISALKADSPESKPAVLADTAVSDGLVLPFSEIRCDRVGRYIAPLVRRPSERDAAFGRALGRVAAHEMYHVFVETKVHGRDGVARACHRAQDLVAPHFTFDPPETEQLRAYGERFSHADVLR